MCHREDQLRPPEAAGPGEAVQCHEIVLTDTFSLFRSSLKCASLFGYRFKPDKPILFHWEYDITIILKCTNEMSSQLSFRALKENCK